MDNKLIFKRKAIFLLFVSLVIFFASFLIHDLYKDVVTDRELTENIQDKIFKKEKEADQILNNAIDKLNSGDALPDFESLARLFSGIDRKNISVLVFRSDSLIYWTDNNIQVEPVFDGKRFDKPSLNISNGWFDRRIRQDSAYTLLALIKIKMTYSYENDYLSNSFASYINATDEIKVSGSPADYNIYNAEGDFLLSLDFRSHAAIPDSLETTLAIAFILSYLLFLSAIHYAYKFLGCYYRKKYLLLLSYAFDVILVRFLLLYYNIPGFIDHAELFYPQFYASSMLSPSLGDLFLNLASIFAVGYVFFHTVNVGELLRIRNRVLKQVLTNLFILSIFLLFVWLVISLKGIVMNSSFSLNLAEVTGIDFFSIIGFFCFSMYLFVFILFTFKPAVFIFQVYSKNWQAFLLLLAYHLVFVVLLRSVMGIDLIYLFFLALYFLVIWYIEKELQANSLFTSTVLLILLFSVFSTYTLNKSVVEKERTNRVVLAQDFLHQKDPILEYKFAEADKQIQADTVLQDMLSDFPFKDNTKYDNTIDYIYQKYFATFSTNSDVWLTLCNPEWLINVQSDTIADDCFSFFYGAIYDFGMPTDYENLHFIDNVRNEDNYLGIITLPVPDKDLRLFVEIFNKYINQAIGFSELLTDSRKESGQNLAGYSYCRYENGNQLNQVGNYFYPVKLSEFMLPDTGLYFFDLAGFNHLYYSPDSANAILLSRKNPGFIDKIAPFSYISIFLGLMAIVFFILFRGPGSIKFTPLSFKKQTQLSITAILVVSFLFVGVGSLFYITTLNHNKNISILQEKSKSVLIELLHKVSNNGGIEQETDGILAGYLVKFSQVFFTDINLYDLDGQLMATSAQGIFRKGLASRTMNSEAFLNMHSFGKSLFIHQEKIGDYNFLSAYRPLLEDDGRVIAYMNLPYFAKQDELTSEISTFLVAFINVYVILIAISIYLALAISNYITKPIELIREKIGRLKLGKAAEKIEWKRHDEIGSLVEEYNRMVDELALSAELLAKSERETAWREMAKQIAHEIKNPLTPMKLSVQYLKKAWDDKAPGWDERLERFTNTIIEQINSLSIIASEFSDFAKMPRSNFREIDLAEIMENAIGIFRGSSEITFSFDYSGKHIVYADKDQLLRVFNNLIQNSIQAIQDPPSGRISVVLYSDQDNHLVEFSDNGKGIPEEMKEKVFYPNFTTKSGGMGLGLAMAKSIIENAKGTIRFESDESAGTTFYIAFPKIIS